jgi:hypothetical protein
MPTKMSEEAKEKLRTMPKLPPAEHRLISPSEQSQFLGDLAGAKASGCITL